MKCAPGMVKGKTFACMATTFTRTYGKQQWEIRLFVQGSCETLVADVSMQWQLKRMVLSHQTLFKESGMCLLTAPEMSEDDSLL